MCVCVRRQQIAATQKKKEKRRTAAKRIGKHRETLPAERERERACENTRERQIDSVKERIECARIPQTLGLQD